jgi:hypothetical protein
MLPHFVDAFIAAKPELRDSFRHAAPRLWSDIVLRVIAVLAEVDARDRYTPDPNRVHEIDDGDYQGTLVYIIASKGYQPSNYWSVKVSYGSCSGCDTLQRILDYGREPLNEDQLDGLMTLALHIVQGIRPLQGDLV